MIVAGRKNYVVGKFRDYPAMALKFPFMDSVNYENGLYEILGRVFVVFVYDGDDSVHVFANPVLYVDYVKNGDPCYSVGGMYACFKHRGLSAHKTADRTFTFPQGFVSMLAKSAGRHYKLALTANPTLFAVASNHRYIGVVGRGFRRELYIPTNSEFFVYIEYTDKKTVSAALVELNNLNMFYLSPDRWPPPTLFKHHTSFA